MGHMLPLINVPAFSNWPLKLRGVVIEVVDVVASG